MVVLERIAWENKAQSRTATSNIANIREIAADAGFGSSAENLHTKSSNAPLERKGSSSERESSNTGRNRRQSFRLAHWTRRGFRNLSRFTTNREANVYVWNTAKLGTAGAMPHLVNRWNIPSKIRFYSNFDFKSAPHLYHDGQLWTINGFYMDKILLPFVFVIMMGRSERDYASVLDVLNLDGPEVLLSDFELAALNAFKNRYTQTEVCFWKNWKINTL